MSLKRPQPLYSICVWRLHILLKKGNRKPCNPNPLTCLPSHTIDELVTTVLLAPYSDRPIADLYILLSTGKCTFLNLNSCDLEAERDIILRILFEGSFEYLRFLFVCTERFARISLIEHMLGSAPNLEEFATDKYFDFNVLIRNKKLRCLRIFNFSEEFVDKKFLKDLSILKYLKKLEVFYISGMHNSPELIDKVLNICPKLISLGLVDSLDGLEIIHRNTVSKYVTSSTDAFSHFSLRRCIWGLSSQEENTCLDINLYKKKFSEKVKIAVSLCPLVQELIFNVYHKDSMEELKNLKKLSFLCIDFRNCDDDYIPAFTSLLQEIGSQLQHLALKFEGSFPLDIIFLNCPNLESLQISNASLATAGKLSQMCSHSNVSVKKLSIFLPGKEILSFLLTFCKNLTFLRVENASCLDDNLMNEILYHNPLSHLQMAGFLNCELSIKSLRTFLSKAVSLEKLSVTNVSNSRLLSGRLSRRNGIHLQPTIQMKAEPKMNVLFVNYLEILNDEFFLCKLNPFIF